MYIYHRCSLIVKQCKMCLNFHYYSYAINSSGKTKIFFTNAFQREYYHISNETIFETKLLNQLLIDLVVKHCNFTSFSVSYNLIHSFETDSRYALNYKRLADTFFMFEIHKFMVESESKQKIKCK